MSNNTEDIEIIEYTLSSIKKISNILNNIEAKYYNTIIADNDDITITKRQAELLLYLYDLPTPPSLRELSRYLATSHQNIKTICLNLEGKSLISFVIDNKDKRKQRIKLTPEGEKKAYFFSTALMKISQQITPTFSSREIDELSRLIRKAETSILEQSSLINKNSKN